MVNVPTRVTKKTATCIDHLFTKYDLQVDELHEGITDHSMILFHLCIKDIVGDQRVTSDHPRVSIPLKIKIDYDRFQNEVAEADWSPVLNETDVSKAFSTFHEILLNKASLSKATIINNNSGNNLKPWMTKRLVKKI
jgi:hypothetical protein